MIRLIGEKLRQYEKNRQVELIPKKGVDLTKVAFEKSRINFNATAEASGEGWVANIPDALLMDKGVIRVTYEGINDDGYKVIESENFVIGRAERPSDYEEPAIDMTSGTGGVSSWNDLTDKPFGEEIKTVNEFTVDRTQTYEEFNFGGTSYPTMFSKVSDEVYTVEGDNREAILHCCYYSDGEITQEYDWNAWCYDRGDGSIDIEYSNTTHAKIITAPYEWNGEIASTGVYLRNTPTQTITSVKANFVSKTIKKIDEKYLPDSAGGGIVIVHLTEDMFGGTYHIDKTGEEIVTLFKNGVLPILMFGDEFGEIFHLATTNEDNSVVFEHNTYRFTISADGTNIEGFEF